MSDKNAHNTISEEEREFFENLTQNCQSDPQALFEGDAIERLAALKIQHPGDYEAIRQRIKRDTGVRIGVLDEQVTKAVSRTATHSPTQAVSLVEIANGEAGYFQASDGTYYADVFVHRIRHTHPIESKGFIRWLRNRHYEETGGLPNSDSVSNAVEDILNAAEIKSRGKKHKIFTRVAHLDGCVYIDLADDEFRCLEIPPAPAPWRIIQNPPVRFKRASGMLPLPAPVGGGSINELKSLLNISSDAELKLVVGYCLAYYMETGTFPVFAITAEHGSGKSWTSKRILDLLNPQVADSRSLPRQEEEFYLASSNSRIACYDNLGKLPSWASDAICRICSGSSYARRKQNTNSEEVIIHAHSSFILNGISDIIANADLAERSIFLHLKPISEKNRRSEKELDEAFQEAKARILGVLAKAVSVGLARLPEIKLSKHSRLEDFRKWVVACEPALWEEGGFEKAYDENRKSVVKNIVENDVVADAVVGFMDEKTEWFDSPTKLLQELKDFAEDPRNLPRVANDLSRRLKLSVTFLRELGITVEWISRKILICKIGSPDLPPPTDNILSLRNGYDTCANHSNAVAVQPAMEGNLALTVSNNPLKESDDSIYVTYNDNRQDVLREVEITHLPGNDNHGDKDNLPQVISCQGDKVEIQPRTIYHGDNLAILKQMKADSVDLIATDPPFNTGQEWQGSSGASFSDEWNWERDVRREWLEDIGRIEEIADYVACVRKTNSSMGAYLCFMAPRLMEMKRVLKDTGSIYLHCDPTASHYLKMLMDVIFGVDNFRNEIVWCYAPSGNTPKKFFPRKHDTILFYAKSDKSIFSPQYVDMTEQTRKSYSHVDENGRRYYQRSNGGRTYLDESKGRPVPSWWNDIPSFVSASNSKERCGYPTQKPLALYERIIEASSNEGDVVLDPFCGSGTTLEAAEQLGRQWIGIDESEDACHVAQRRFSNVEETDLNGLDTPPETDTDDIPEKQQPKASQNGIIAGSSIDARIEHGNGNGDVQTGRKPEPEPGNDNSYEDAEVFTKDESVTKNLPAIIPYQSQDAINIQPRTIYQGDNLEILRQMEADSIDLIATDPPFNTNKIWKGKSGSFDDRFESMDAYVEGMRERIIEMHRILKVTGSIYLHCDPTASHYLKVMMDAIFGRENFRNEITWCYTKLPNKMKGFQKNHDVILFYSASANYIFNPQYGEMSKATRNSLKSKMNIGYNANKVKKMVTVYDWDKYNEAVRTGKLPKDLKPTPFGDGKPRMRDWWDDISILSPTSKERVKYPTQKPVALYERIIKASSNQGDVVLDPFMGSGTTLLASENLGRKWIGIDSSKDACGTAQGRFKEIDLNIPVHSSTPQTDDTPQEQTPEDSPVIIGGDIQPDTESDNDNRCEDAEFSPDESSTNNQPRIANRYVTEDALVFLKQMKGKGIAGIATSPPYNKAFNGRGRKHGSNWKNSKLMSDNYPLCEDNMPEEEYIAWQREVIKASLEVVGDEGVVLYNIGRRIKNLSEDSGHSIVEGFPVRQTIIWNRGSAHNHGGVRPSTLPAIYELIYVIAGKNWRLPKKYLSEFRHWGDVWRINPEKNNPHPAPFPLELGVRMAKLIDGPLADPFAGSGTMGIAAMEIGVPYVLNDHAPEYKQMFDDRRMNCLDLYAVSQDGEVQLAMGCDDQDSKNIKRLQNIANNNDGNFQKEKSNKGNGTMPDKKAKAGSEGEKP